MKKKKKRVKLKSLSKLKIQLWDLFSLYIRLKYSDSEGICTCVSCGTKKHYKQMQAGHYAPKSLGLSLYFYERNVHVQCYSCNIPNKDRAIIQYAKFMVKTYGPKVLDEIDKVKTEGRNLKYSRSDYMEMIEKFNRLREELKRKREGIIFGKH